MLALLSAFSDRYCPLRNILWYTLPFDTSSHDTWVAGVKESVQVVFLYPIYCYLLEFCSPVSDITMVVVRSEVAFAQDG